MAQEDTPTKRGRRSLLDQAMRDKADNYLVNYEACGDAFPSIAGLADELGVTRKTLYNWSESDADFLYTLEEVSIKQERVCLAKGIKGEFTTPITKLVLANHGYTDKIQQDVTSSDGSAVMPKAIRLVPPEFEDDE